ncbi:hypothetical protein AMATHDRAFT_10490 [Amanita thiersii Skay4041]|uniref:Uncharacterized protein n=1 Tax=Amanita thiersii Skay4041 TaxID=703135 RepID=A0A2A9N5W6_9AGAR|nr:hypothetical protein AMATHDRAFT_10490 [Amanita thiersii Skay4041]
MLPFLPVLPLRLPYVPTHCNMLAALGEVNIFFPGWYDGETGQLDHAHVINVRREGGDILQKILQEGSGGDGLNEAIGGGFGYRDLEIVVGVNGEGGHTGEDLIGENLSKNPVSARVAI